MAGTWEFETYFHDEIYYDCKGNFAGEIWVVMKLIFSDTVYNIKETFETTMRITSREGFCVTHYGREWHIGETELADALESISWYLRGEKTPSYSFECTRQIPSRIEYDADKDQYYMDSWGTFPFSTEEWNQYIQECEKMEKTLQGVAKTSDPEDIIKMIF